MTVTPAVIQPSSSNGDAIPLMTTSTSGRNNSASFRDGLITAMAIPTNTNGDIYPRYGVLGRAVSATTGANGIKSLLVHAPSVPNGLQFVVEPGNALVQANSTTGGYLVGCSYTHWAVFDLKPDTDVYWCSADIGWVTGHSYIVYGPLANGVTQVLYEGTPDTPERGRWWQIIEKYGVTIFYTAPTAIRSFMKQGHEIPDRSDMSSLRILGSVGEPINPEAYVWYRHVIGGDRTPVVDTWWQTETGSIMISPLPGVTASKPGAAMRPIPGISAEVVDDAGKPVPDGGGGYLVITEPWPSMLRTIWGDDKRFIII